MFGFKINYNTIEGSTSAANKLYNGNIAETFWSSGSDGVGTIRAYGYKYDNLNRLKVATSFKKASLPAITNFYGESLTYDKNGNIQTLVRNGVNTTEVLPVSKWDDLTYTYKSASSNQLLSVNEGINGNPAQGFKDVNTTNDYFYDDNGNMTVDKNKGITAIVYNHLNLPTKITFGTTGNIVYIYNALGQKVEKTVTQGTTVSKTNYLGGYQYNGVGTATPTLQFFPTAEGYVTKTGTVYSYVFNYTDHLGNVRLSYSKDTTTGSLKIIDESNYYPFGLKHSGYNIIAPATDNKYKYNGKELQDELGLNVYDYGARNYDPALGRWMNVDPLAEKYFEYSPFSYAINNPVFFIDPNGKEVDVSALADSKSKDDNWLLIQMMLSLADISGKTISKSVDKDGKTTLTGSGKGNGTQASKYVTHLLTMSETITVGSSDSGSMSFPNGEVYLDAAQINGMQKGLEKKGIDKDVMSVGMAFIHETLHTTAGANWWKKEKSENQKDQFGRFLDYGDGPGNVDNRTNAFKQELNLPTFYKRGTDTTLYLLIKGKKVEVDYNKKPIK